MARKHFNFKDEMRLLDKGEYDQYRYVSDMNSIDFYTHLAKSVINDLKYYLEYMDDIEELIKHPYSLVSNKAYWTQRWIELNQSCDHMIDLVIHYIQEIREIRSNY